MSEAAHYELPTGELGLKGPIARPVPGTLPLRGDLAHIALADRYLVPHYVVPQVRRIGALAIELKLTADASSQTLVTLPPNAVFEVLDFQGEWSWGCVSAEGPTGYIPKSALAPEAK